jgi:hypothetical protein
MEICMGASFLWEVAQARASELEAMSLEKRDAAIAVERIADTRDADELVELMGKDNGPVTMTHDEICDGWG